MKINARVSGKVDCLLRDVLFLFCCPWFISCYRYVC